MKNRNVLEANGNLRRATVVRATCFSLRLGYTCSRKGKGVFEINYCLNAVLLVLYVITDCLLLVGADQAAGIRSSNLRIILATVFDVVLSACSVKSEWSGWTYPLIQTGAGIIAYGIHQGSILKIVIFIFIKMLIVFGRDAHQNVAGYCITIFFTMGLIIYNRTEQTKSDLYQTIVITNGAKSVKLIALRDTGNTLCDPISGENVLIIDADAAEALTGLSNEQLYQPFDTLVSCKKPGLKLIPYHTVGSKGMLLAMRFQSVKIGNTVYSKIVAFSPSQIGDGYSYRALMGGE